MADIGAVLAANLISNLISVRSVESGGADGATQAANTLKAQPGQLVQGTIFGLDQSGEPLLKSDQGNLALKLPFHLPSGTDVVLRVEAAAGGSRARILSIDGVPLKTYVAQLATSAQGQTSPNQDIVSVPTALTQNLPRGNIPLPNTALSGGTPATAAATIKEGIIPGTITPSALASLDTAQAARVIQVRNDPVSALLLSRNPQLSSVLPQLPPGIDLPPRLQPGNGILFELIEIEKDESTSTGANLATGGKTTAGGGNAPTSGGYTPTAADFGQLLGRLAAQQQARGAVISGASPEEAAINLQAATQTTAPATPATQTPQVIPATQQAAQSLQNVVAAVTAADLIQEGSISAAPATDNTAPNVPNVALHSQALASGAKLQPGETLELEIPANTAPPVNLPPKAGSFGGQVVEVDQGGNALVQTVFGIVRLPPGPVQLQEGDKVLWRLHGFTAAPPTARNTDPQAQLMGLAKNWDSLDDAVNLLAAAASGHDGIGPQSLLSHLPQPDGKMGAAIAFFVAALRRNEAQSWIGKNTVSHLIEAKRGDLIQSLEADFGLIREPLVNSPSPQWQALFFPVYVEQQLHQARLFIHRNPERENGPGEVTRSQDVRFVLELELPVWGDVQLCGLVRKPEPGNVHFDLAIRSLAAVGKQHQQEIQGIFQQGAELTGYKGQLQFQQVREFQDSPMESFASALPGWTA